MLISASAGTGKTYQLSLRFLGLLPGERTGTDEDGEGPEDQGLETVKN